jgi:hypothetical protein
MAEVPAVNATRARIWFDYFPTGPKHLLPSGRRLDTPSRTEGGDRRDVMVLATLGHDRRREIQSKDQKRGKFSSGIGASVSSIFTRLGHLSETRFRKIPSFQSRQTEIQSQVPIVEDKPLTRSGLKPPRIVVKRNRFDRWLRSRQGAVSCQRGRKRRIPSCGRCKWPPPSRSHCSPHTDQELRPFRAIGHHADTLRSE